MIGYRPHLSRLSPELLSELVRRVVQAADPEKVILFGSRGRGDHRPHSDIDLLVVQRSARPRHQRPAPIHAALADLPIQVDVEIAVYTPEEVEEYRGAPAAFVSTALREGTVLYEK